MINENLPHDEQAEHEEYTHSHMMKSTAPKLTKENAQIIIDTKYTYGLYYDKLATVAYAVNALGIKRIAMELSEDYLCWYSCLRNTFIKQSRLVIYPNMAMTSSLVNSISVADYDPCNVSPEEFISVLKEIMNYLRECEEENAYTVNKAVVDIEHSKGRLYKKVMRSNCLGEHYIGKINKMEMLYDKYGWDPKFVMNHQKIVHDLIKKGKY